MIVLHLGLKLQFPSAVPPTRPYHRVRTYSITLLLGFVGVFSVPETTIASVMTTMHLGLSP